MEALSNVQGRSMADPCILHTTAFNVIEEEFKSVIQEIPTCTCDICCKFEWSKNIMKLYY